MRGYDVKASDQSKTAKILAPLRYPWTFNGPRNSRHHIDRRQFIPFNKISQKIEGVTLFNPLPLKSFDFIHAFNRIPLGTTPYIISFESHLPRAFGLEHTKYFERLSLSLAGERCIGIFAISEYAKRHFITQHKNYPWFNDLVKKLYVRYPNMPIANHGDEFDGTMKPIRLIFIGNHFTRKGGIAVLKLAQLAEQQGIDMHVDIISALQSGSWVDPLLPNYFSRHEPLCRNLKNIKIHGHLPNQKVLELCKKAHFSLLPTLSDTFGFSVIESMANYVPTIATAQGALPEFMIDGHNGFLLPMTTTPMGEWEHILYTNKATPHYADLFDAENDRLALLMLENIKKVINHPELYSSLRTNARATAQTLFNADDANHYWDHIYSSVR